MASPGHFSGLQHGTQSYGARSDHMTRCYLVTTDCSPKPIPYFHGMEYIPKKGERLTCPSDPGRYRQILQNILQKNLL